MYPVFFFSIFHELCMIIHHLRIPNHTYQLIGNQVIVSTPGSSDGGIEDRSGELTIVCFRPIRDVQQGSGMLWCGPSNQPLVKNATF